MKLKYNKTKTRFVIVLILYAFTPYFLDLTCSAQDELPTEVVYEMKRQLLKRIAMKRANGILKYYFPDKENTRAVAPEVINVNTFCFGFLPDFLEIELQKSKLNGILGDEYVLYEAQFSRQNANNKNINQWTAFQVDNFFFRQIGLLALKGNKEVILLSSYGGGLTPSCRAILESRPKDMKWHENYYKLLYYRSFPNGITVEQIRNDTVVFKHVYEWDSGSRKIYRVYYSAKIPGKMFGREQLLDDPSTKDITTRKSTKRFEMAKLPFEGTDDKKRYLFEALMENIYLYKFHQKISSLPDSLDVETLVDSLLPDYDVYLPRMYHLRYGCCWKSEERVKELESRLPSTMAFFFDYEFDSYMKGNIKYKYVASEGRIYHKNIEYYKIYMDTLLLWHKREDSQFVGHINWDDFNKDFIYDTYYQKNGKQSNRVSTPLVVNPNNPLAARYLSECTVGGSFDTAYNHYDYPYQYIKQPRANHYLLALDTENRNVYFLSGKDIFLTQGVPLYLPYSDVTDSGKRIIVHDNPDYSKLYQKGDWRILFTYIQDRLYRYLVERLDRSNVIYEDEEKVVLRCKGEEYKKEIELEVTLYFDDPENLEIKRLN